MGRHKDFDRLEVLHRALDVFWRKGYGATSMADLLDVMGLSKSSLYATFGGKRELFVAAFDAYREERTLEMHTILEQGPARQAIERFYRKMIYDPGNGDSSRGCMSINQAVEMAPHDSDIRTRVLQDFAVIEDGFTHAIERGQHEGTINSACNARILARMLVMAFPGLQVMVRAGGDREKIAESLNLLLSSLD